MARTPRQPRPVDPGSEHRITQRVALLCPEHGHYLGRVDADAVRLHVLPATDHPSWEDCLHLGADGRTLHWLCWPCVRTGPGKAWGKLPMSGLCNLLARMTVYGPAQLETVVLPARVARLVPARDGDRDRIQRRREQLTPAEGTPLPASWAHPRQVVATDGQRRAEHARTELLPGDEVRPWPTPWVAALLGSES